MNKKGHNWDNNWPAICQRCGFERKDDVSLQQGWNSVHEEYDPETDTETLVEEWKSSSHQKYCEFHDSQCLADMTIEEGRKFMDKCKQLYLKVELEEAKNALYD